MKSPSLCLQNTLCLLLPEHRGIDPGWSPHQAETSLRAGTSPILLLSISCDSANIYGINRWGPLGSILWPNELRRLIEFLEGTTANSYFVFENRNHRYIYKVTLLRLVTCALILIYLTMLFAFQSAGKNPTFEWHKAISLKGGDSELNAFSP